MRFVSDFYTLQRTVVLATKSNVLHGFGSSWTFLSRIPTNDQLIYIISVCRYQVPNIQRVSFRFDWCGGCWNWGLGQRKGARKGVDPTNFQELTKLQTPKAPAVGIVQHTGQPPGKSETGQVKDGESKANLRHMRLRHHAILISHRIRLNLEISISRNHFLSPGATSLPSNLSKPWRRSSSLGPSQLKRCFGGKSEVTLDPGAI